VNADPILVAGAGSWGTALAILLARNGQPTRLWGRGSEHIARLAEDRRNQRYLPGAPFPAELQLATDLNNALAGTRDVIVALPCAGLREFLLLAAKTPGNRRYALACKGLEPGTQRLPHEIVAEVLGPATPVAIISGPTFAAEVARDLPTAVTVASQDLAFAQDLVSRLHSKTFRAYTSADVTGVAIAGAVKNVLAIAAGVADGLGFGANTRAALITRGLAEMTRLGRALGGQSETFMGLAGLGDLLLTCTDDQSRNRRIGLALARGETIQAASAALGQVAEGVRTAEPVVQLAARLETEMPICAQVARLVRGECSPREAVGELLGRDPKPEG
jgi:glycerol-3-phosphate dehydrogenase (NAD(P)+)